MKKTNIVYIATSLDGFIADKNEGLDWLHAMPNPENSDMGFGALMEGIDALVMGRNTYETVLGFDIDWPYSKPVFVLSNSLTSVPEKVQGKVHLVKGPLTEVLAEIHQKGFTRLYIDGGTTIQNFLKEDLIDKMILTTIPILLGGGVPLFSTLPDQLQFECTATELFSNKVVQNTFHRKRA